MTGSRILAVLLALTTAAALWTAGTSTQVGVDEQQALSAQRVARTLSCVTGLPGGRAVAGTLAGKLRASGPLRSGTADVSGKEPFVVRAGRGAAPTTFASQSARAGKWFAAQPCAEPSRQQWFLGAGGSRLHHSMLTLANTRAGEAVVDVRIFGPRGELEVPGLRGLSVKGEPTRLNLTEVAPSVEDLAVSVTAVRGLVSSSVVDVWAPTAAEKPLTEFLPGQSEPATDLVLGGLPANPRDAVLTVLNTGENAAVLKIRLIGKDGTFEATRTDTITAPPGELVQFPVPSAGRQGASGLRITSPEPVVAGIRARTQGDVIHGSTLGALGDSSILGVPDGSKATLRLFNPDADQPITATVAFTDVRGSVLKTRQVAVQPGTAVVVASKPLRDGKVRAIRIIDGGELRAVLDARNGGAAVMPFQSVTGETRVPAVRARG